MTGEAVIRISDVKNLGGGRLAPRMKLVLLLNKVWRGINVPGIGQSRQKIGPSPILRLFIPKASVANIRDRTILGFMGQIPVRVYAPEIAQPLPILVFMHGGGWGVGNLDTNDGLCRYLARKAGCVVVSVEYRLAPEHKFPAALDDVYSVLHWVSENAPGIGGDTSRIGIAGISAGGNLAAAVTLMARDRGGPEIVYQLLIYPVTNISTLDTSSYQLYGGGEYGLTKAGMSANRDAYLTTPADASQAYVSPLCARDLTRLPPALIITAEFDPLRDEGEAYAVRLQQAGVPASCTRYNGMTHGFTSYAGILDYTTMARDEAAAALRFTFEKRTHVR